MPPVRWKLWVYVMAIYVQAAFVVTAAQQMQDSISMSSDGWRPIVGTRRQPAPNESGPERTHYPNQNQAFDVIPAEVVNIEATTLPYIHKSSPHKNVALKEKKQGVKLKHAHKTGSHHFISTGQHQSSFPVSHQYKKAVKKPVMVQNKPRKPSRGQALAHSTRNEIFVPPPLPSNTGSFSIVKSVTPNNIKIREAQGFGLIGNNYAISQQNAHIELARFPLTGESILQRPTFFLAKPLQNDEFSRNLVPPPPRSRVQQKTKGDTKISLYAFKEGPATDASSSVPQFGSRPNHFLPQVSPTFEFSSQQQIPKSQQIKDQAIDVQVTKENLKHFPQNGAPSPGGSQSISFGNTRNNYPIGFVEYDFQQRTPQNSPSPITYEVTEGKYLDTPSQQYQFRPQDGFFQFQNHRQQHNARPGLLFQAEVSTQSPPVFEAPLVDLSVPPFLPTPYKPESGVIPTSPTQSEAATVFTQVSKKMNRYRNNALKDNPLFFNIKEVSTHYPVLGAPEAQSDGGTDTPFAINENGEISNEITTTQRERTRRPTKDPTPPTSTRDPTKARITNRRRPRPRKPSTTTTEEPVVETYEPLKSQESIEEVPVETVKPPRRRRPKPTAYRTQQVIPSGVRGPTENKDIDENSSGRHRGRNRFRTRERPSTERIDTNVIKRKRLRPSYTENAIREQLKHSYEETTKPSIEHEQYSFERDSSADHSYSQEYQHSVEAQSQSFETEMPERHFEPTQDLPLQQQSRPFIEEIHPATEKVEDFERTRAPISSTEREFSTHFHIPENEIDYTTQSHTVQDESSEEFTTSTATTTTSTTQPTATVEASSTKSTRIRRPSKYDSSNRPRFSVKDYKQRLTQYTSTTPSSTTQAKNNSDNMRLRFPNRLRTRPSPTSSSGRLEEVVSEESTTTIRSRFKPKDPRHQTTTESDLVITEKAVKAINTNLRPFGRSTKPTVETTPATPKVSIRPNLFSARRRAGYPSLKSRIQNKLKRNDTEENDTESTTVSQNEIEDIDPLNAAESATTEVSSTTTDFSVISPTSQEISTESTEKSVTDDIMKSDDFMYSQRVSDLTSSFKDYDKPGMFNSVAPTSRSIPNYFTISTDDPILPIEAFFPSLKEKDKAKER